MNNKLIGACGADCGGCPYYKVSCEGCFALAGKPFWAADHLPSGLCPLFDCSINGKNLDNCSKCLDLPCKMFFDLKDPSMSEEEHRKSVTDRVNRLKSLY